MSWYVKKPVRVEAVQWTSENLEEVTALAGPALVGQFWNTSKGDHVLRIMTLNGKTEACKDDWIIRGPMGDVWPCKPDIFAESYSPVDS